MLYESRSVRHLKQRRNDSRMAMLGIALFLTIALAVCIWIWAPHFVARAWPVLAGSNSQPPIAPEASLSTIVEEDEATLAASATTTGFSWTTVDDEYFSDALFVGDSLTYGLEAYGIIPQAAFIAAPSVNLESMSGSTDYFTSSAGTPLTMLEAISALQPVPSKIYVMMGTNGINWQGFGQMLTNYGLLIDHLKVAFPQATIYVQSITPVTEQVAQKQPGFAVSNIRSFNDNVKTLASEKDAIFLDLFAELAGEGGLLPESVAAGDGIHLTPDCYQHWYTYLKQHAVVSSLS